MTTNNRINNTSLQAADTEEVWYKQEHCRGRGFPEKKSRCM